MSTVYLHVLDAADQEKIQALKRRFGRSGFLAKLRNEHAFHYPRETAIEASFQTLPDGEDWDFYASVNVTNTFSWASEPVIVHALHRITGEDSVVKATEIIRDEIIDAASLLEDVSNGLMKANVMRHFKDAIRGRIEFDLLGIAKEHERSPPIFC